MKDIKILQFQIHGLGLLIECNRAAPNQYPERAVRMKKGVLVSIAGQFMPNNPPPYRTLSLEEWVKFSQNQFKNLADIDRERRENSSKSQEEILDFSSSELKVKQEEVASQLANSIAAQPKENIIEWVKDTCSDRLQEIAGSVEEFLGKVIFLADRMGDFTESFKSSILSFIKYEEISNSITKAINNNTQYQYIKGLVNGVINRYNQALEGLKHLDNQPAIVQQLGKIAAASIPVIATIAAAAVPVIGLEILFPPLALMVATPASVASTTKLVTIGLLKLAANINLSSTLLKLDRDARGVTQEDLKKLPAWGKTLSLLREMLFGLGVGSAINAGCEIAQIQLRVLPNVNKGIAKYLETIPEEIAAKNQSAVLELRSLADEVAARPMPKPIAAHVDNILIDREKRVLKVLGNSKESKQLLKLADENVARIINESDLYMKISEENLVKVIERKKFTNAFENLEEGKYTGITFSGKKKPPATKKMPSFRYNAEQKLFGIDKSAKGSERPVYGYFARGGRSLSTEEGYKTKAYGDIAVKLKSSVKPRVTITPDDSAAITSGFPGMAATRIENPKAVAFVSDQYLGSKFVKPTELADGLKSISESKDIYELMKATGRFWGRSIDESLVEDDILAKAKDILAKGIKPGTPEFKKELEKALGTTIKIDDELGIKVKVKIRKNPTNRTAYLEWQAHNGLLAEDIEEVVVTKISHRALKLLVQDVRKLRNGVKIEGNPSQDFIDLINWADMMGVKVSSAQ